MKTLQQLFMASMLVTLVACNQENKTSEANKAESMRRQKNITFDDFKKIKGVDNVQEVPFHVFTKLDSIHFFVAPSKDSASLKIAYDKLDNFYGFSEFDDFYSIHFSINNNISNSIEAFVLKSEFTAAFDLTLKGVDLYQIRSSTLNEVNDFKNKSFSRFGTIVEVEEQEFNTASKSKINEGLVKNPSVKVKGENWVTTDGDKETVIVLHENVSTEDGPLNNEYVGRSPYLNLEVFKETSVDVPDTYYSFYSVKPSAEFRLFTGGYPQIIPSKNWISYVGSNNDVGSNFTICKYVERNITQGDLLYINFTNFKVASETNAFWADDRTFYLEAYPVNSASTRNRRQKTAFLKIQLKPNLF